MIDLKEFTTEQLEGELARRVKEAKHKKPVLLASFNLVPLQNKCQEYIDWITSGEYNKDQDIKWESFISGLALKMLFGEDVFSWWNEVADD